MSLKKRYYRKYDGGGGMNLASLASGGGDPYTAMIMMAQQLGTGMVDALAPPNEFGHQGAIASAIKGNYQMGTPGAIMGYFKGKRQEEMDRYSRLHNEMSNRDYQYKRAAAAVSTNPALVTGNQGADYYAMGGTLKNRYYDHIYAEGGNLKSLSSDAAEVQGPSHEQGGVDLPQYGSELEGGETIQDDYVFSDRLGFAQQHKKLARAIGKIEEKPATPDRINSLRRMYQSVQNLKNQQEQIRQQYNLQ